MVELIRAVVAGVAALLQVIGAGQQVTKAEPTATSYEVRPGPDFSRYGTSPPPSPESRAQAGMP